MADAVTTGTLDAVVSFADPRRLMTIDTLAITATRRMLPAIARTFRLPSQPPGLEDRGLAGGPAAGGGVAVGPLELPIGGDDWAACVSAATSPPVGDGAGLGVAVAVMWGTGAGTGADAGADDSRVPPHRSQATPVTRAPQRSQIASIASLSVELVVGADVPRDGQVDPSGTGSLDLIGA